MTYILNPDGSYMNENEILGNFIASSSISMDAQTVAILRNDFKPTSEMDHYEAVSCALLFSEMGRWMRNSYGLWAEDNPHVVLNPEPNNQNIIDHPLFPDNFSGRILDRFIAHVKSLPFSLDQA